MTLKPTHSTFSLVFVAAGAFACSGDDTTPPPVTVPDIEIQTSTLPEGQQGQPYSAEIRATGGSGEGYRWSVLGSLPTGLFMSSSGTSTDDGATRVTTILGTPQVNGSYTFKVRLNDADRNSAEVELTIALGAAPPALAIVTTALPDGGSESPYRASLEAENGAAPYRWSLVGGALPAGLTLSEDGEIAGQPQQPAMTSFEVRVTDAEGATARTRLSLTIQDESRPLALVTTDLPDGVVDLAFTTELAAENGSPPYTWAVIGTAPPGLAIAPEGNPTTLSGTPTMAGSYTFQIEVTDAREARVRRTFFVEIERAPPPVRITTQPFLPSGEVNSPYQVRITGVNGSGQGYTWRVSRGQLPAGLTLAPSGTPDTTISGAPTQAGQFTFDIEVRDDAGRTYATEFNLRVIDQIFPIEVINTSTTPGQPQVLPSVRLGESFEATFTARNGFGRYNWVVSQGRLPAGLSLTVPGTPSTRITGFAGERGTFPFSVTVYDERNETATASYVVTILGPEFPVNITTTAVTDGRTCNAYRATLEAQQGSNVGYRWSIVGGALPPGLRIDPAGTPATRIRGTVPGGTNGSYTFTVRVQDSSGDTFDQAYTMNVVDDGTGDRWLVVMGDIFTDNVNEIGLSPICQSTPGPVVRVTPTGLGNPSGGVSSTTNSYYGVSPDGTKAAFSGDFRVSGFEEMWVVDLTGNPPFTATVVSPSVASTTLHDAFDLKWAPDSNHLAFVGDFDTDGVNELYVVDTSGPIVANSAIPVAPTMPSDADVDAQDYVWSPDGRWLAYSNDTAGASVYEAWLWDSNVGTARSAVRVTPTLPSTSADVNYPFVWSPDSQYLMYNCDCEVALQDELYIVDVTQVGLPTRKISHQASGGNVIWTSSEVIPSYYGFTSNGLYAYYRSDLGDTGLGDTLYAVDLSNPTARGVEVFARPPSLQDVLYIRPSGPDGSGVVVMGDLEVSSLNELYHFDLSQPFPQPPGSHKISGTIQPNGDIASYTDFEVSPDGDHVVFLADAVVEGLDQAFLVDLRGATASEPALISLPTTDALLDTFNIYWSPASNYVALVGYPYTSGVYEVLGVDVTAGAPYEPVRLNTPMTGSEDVNIPVIWRSDGGGIFYEGDHGAAAVEQAWWVDVTNPGVSVPLTSVPTNGDVVYIEAQGQ